MPVQNIPFTKGCLEVLENIGKYCDLPRTRLIEDVLEMSLDQLPYGHALPNLVRGILTASRYRGSGRISLSSKNRSNLRSTAAAYGMRIGDVIELVLLNYYEDHLQEWQTRYKSSAISRGIQQELPY
jgi:hypothetical protein